MIFRSFASDWIDSRVRDEASFRMWGIRNCCAVLLPPLLEKAEHARKARRSNLVDSLGLGSLFARVRGWNDSNHSVG